MNATVDFWLSAVGVSLVALEVLIVVVFFVAGFWGYGQIAGIKKNVKGLVSDEVKDFMESTAGRRALEDMRRSSLNASIDETDEQEE